MREGMDHRICYPFWRIMMPGESLVAHRGLYAPQLENRYQIQTGIIYIKYLSSTGIVQHR